MIHFEYYPSIEYSNNQAKNILVRGKIRDVVLNEGALYYKYTVPDDMKPETIAHKYYGSPNYVWAIYYANNIFDPINEWIKSPSEFERYVIQKYGTVESAMRLKNSDGSMNWDSIHHFIEVDPDDKKTYVIDRITFENKIWQGAFPAGKTVLTKLKNDTPAEQIDTNGAHLQYVTLDKGTSIVVNSSGYNKLQKATLKGTTKNFLIPIEAIQIPSTNDINVKAITNYEYERELNENRRDIIVLDKSFLLKIVNELRNLFVES